MCFQNDLYMYTMTQKWYIEMTQTAFNFLQIFLWGINDTMIKILARGGKACIEEVYLKWRTRKDSTRS